MAAISDKRLQHSSDGTGIDYFDADVQSAQEYYAFGAIIKGTAYNAPGNGYRYGFNGKENDNEVKKDQDGNNLTGGQQDYGMRIYDPRLGRFFSVDPLSPKYPELTPYQFASNRPIDGIDQDGLEYASGMFKVFADNAKKGEDPLKALQQSAKSTFETIGNLVYGTISTIFALPNMASNMEAASNTHNPQAKAYLVQEARKNFAEAFVGLGTAEIGGRAFGLAAEAESFLSTEDFSKLSQKGLVNPNRIRFSQNSISSEINGSGSEKVMLNNFISDLRSGKVDGNTIKPIRITKINGQVYTLDNRRLHAFQEAGINVPYEKIDVIPKKELFKFTTQNQGTSIEVRKPK